MALNELPLWDAGYFTQLPAGAIDLGVPLHDNAVQISDDILDPDARLYVTTTPHRHVHIGRTDRSPLQVQFVTNARNPELLIRHDVFARPIDELQLLPTVSSKAGQLCVAQAKGAELEIADADRFQMFIEMIAGHALQKAL